MKKVLTLLVLLTSLFMLNLNYKAETEAIKEKEENYYIIDFKNLNSKNLNELLSNINGTIINIEVTTKEFTKTYTFNTRIINNLEEQLTDKVVKDLINMNKRESATYYQTKGYKINKIEIICTKKMVNILKNLEEEIYNRQ